jgi:aminoglycoside 3-N-acetyltransferase I
VSYAYRHLSPTDLPLMHGLLKMFGQAFDDPRSYQGAVPSDGYLASLLGKPHFIALAALEGGRVVGGLCAYVLDKFEQERSEIYIYDLAVAEAHRRRGIATGLIRLLQRIGAQRGAWVIFVQADPPDQPAIRLYESLGVREEVLHFDLPVAQVAAQSSTNDKQ